MLGDKRQGHPTSDLTLWRSREISSFNLPHTIQMGEEFAFKRESNDRVTGETLWQNEVNRQLNKAFVPESYKVALRNLKVIVDYGNSLVGKKVANVVNPLPNGE